MTTRLRKRLAATAASGRRSLVIYVTQGDPSPDATIDIALAVERGGADVLELGVPFSDPNADGVVIQNAMQRALATGPGAGLEGTLAAVATLRARGCEGQTVDVSHGRHPPPSAQYSPSDVLLQG